jgi:hypothetical protein
LKALVTKYGFKYAIDFININIYLHPRDKQYSPPSDIVGKQSYRAEMYQGTSGK